MAASLSSSRLPNLPLRQRKPSRMAAPTSTTSSAIATIELSQNSQTKLRSYMAGSPDASDTTKPSTSATPRNARTATVHRKRTERRLIANDARRRMVIEVSSTATGRSRIAGLLDRQRALDAQLPLGLRVEVQLHRRWQLRGVEVELEVDVVAVGGVDA